MRTDALLSFVPYGAPLSIVGGSGELFTSNVVDLLGAGVGVAPPNIIGNTTVFGEDPGIGTLRPEIAAVVGTAFATSDSATLNTMLQYAPDQGAAGGYQPGTWQTVAETGYLTAAQLTAQTYLARFPFLPAFPANANPRFLRLAFQVLASTAFTAGTIAYALVTTGRDDQANKYLPNNYVALH